MGHTRKTPKYNSATWKNIPASELDEGVRLLVEHVGMNGGSIGDMDLYVLVRNYLRRSEVRAGINEVLKIENCI